jgi:Fur family ferric uptake transcriptional regulator
LTRAVSNRPSTRRTRQQAEVRGALTTAAEFRSAQHLHADLRDQGARISLTTVYRTLQRLADHGEIDVMRLPGGEQLFRRCQLSAHHHHLVCRRCGHAVEVEDLGVDVQAERLAAKHGFRDVAHTVEIFGICADCAEGPSGPGTRPTSEE